MAVPRRSYALLLLLSVCSSSLAQLAVVPEPYTDGGGAREPSAARDFGDAITLEAVDLSAAANEEPDGEAMQSLLHWAISHSDPDVLRKQAEDAATDRAVEQVVRSLEEQKQRVMELHKYMNSQPTEADVMKEAIALLLNPTSEEADLLAALEALQMLVEPIDNANDLRTMGGILPVASHLRPGVNPRLQELAAHVFGTAASNNPTFQQDLLEVAPTVMVDLLQVIARSDRMASSKALYAVGNIVRNTDAAVDAFIAAGGVSVLVDVMSDVSSGMRLNQRALTLLVDISVGDRRNSNVLGMLVKQAGSVVDLVPHVLPKDLEPVLLALQSLLRASSEMKHSLVAHGAGAATSRVHKTLVDEMSSQWYLTEEDDDGRQYHTYLVKLAQETTDLLGGPTAGGRQDDMEGRNVGSRTDL